MSNEAKLLKSMNPGQTEVIMHDKGPCLAAAVAGAGKTAAIVRRIAYLTTIRDVDPRRVLAVTFSKKAADEMNERLVGLIGETDARIGTFHSLALEVLKGELGNQLGQIDDRNKYRLCIKDATGFRNMNWKDADVTFLESFIGMCKAHMIRPGTPKATELAQKLYASEPKIGKYPTKVLEAYSLAESIRRERQLITFDDMLLDVAEMFEQNDDVRAKWASKWSYVIQDEAQDQNLCQLRMGELLSLDHRNYMIVGDPAQTIYTWRGAQPEKLLGFEKAWNAKVVLMDHNYRCGQLIIDAANGSLRSMEATQKLDMQMVCCRGVSGDVSARYYRNIDEESRSISDEILAIHEDGPKWGDMAVLYRTNAQSRAIEEACLSARIPYRIIGGTNFYERKEVRSLISYLRLADGRGSAEDVTRCLNAPFRFLGKAILDRMEGVGEDEVAAARREDRLPDWTKVARAVGKQGGLQSRQRDSLDQWADLIEDIRERISNAMEENASGVDKDRGKPSAVLEDLVMATKYYSYLEKEEGEESTENSRVSNVRELIRASDRFHTVESLLNYIDNQISESRRERKDENPDKVTLTSIHRSKGMEWPVVFVTGVSDGILPHARCESYDEERRLFYVAVTRARDILRITSARDVSRGKKIFSVDPSPFILEAGLQVIDLTGYIEDSESVESITG